jgi:serine/threonine protein kinase
MGDKNIIGLGSYGCVYKPSLYCDSNANKPPAFYKNKISKLMSSRALNDEMVEHKKIDEIDIKGEYHLKTPFSCDVDKKELKNVAKCAIIKNPENLNVTELARYKLLILENGGIDLGKLLSGGEYKKWKNPEVKEFILSLRDLFKGVKLFNDKGFVHYDIHNKNILYNKTTHKTIFIDFGLSNDKTTIIEDSKINTHFPDVLHWNYPCEHVLLNKRIFENKNFFFDIHENKKKLKEIEETIGDYIKRYNSTGNSVVFNINIKSELKRGITEFLKKNSRKKPEEIYTEFLNEELNKIDIYSLGITLNKVFNDFYSESLIPFDFYNDLVTLCGEMTNFNFMKRITIEEACRKFDTILIKHNDVSPPSSLKTPSFKTPPSSLKTPLFKTPLFKTPLLNRTKKVRPCKYGVRLENGKCPPKKGSCKYGVRLENGKCPPKKGPCKYGVRLENGKCPPKK